MCETWRMCGYLKATNCKCKTFSNVLFQFRSIFQTSLAQLHSCLFVTRIFRQATAIHHRKVFRQPSPMDSRVPRACHCPSRNSYSCVLWGWICAALLPPESSPDPIWVSYVMFQMVCIRFVWKFWFRGVRGIALGDRSIETRSP
jgi:hypothetical protein